MKWSMLLFGCCFLFFLVVGITATKNELLPVNAPAESQEEDQSANLRITEEKKELEEEPSTNDMVFPSSLEEYIIDEFHDPSPEEIKADSSKIYYLALGDSLTKGVGDEEQKNGYTKRLAEKIEQWTDISEVVIDNRGKRGRKSDQLLTLIEKGHYDHELKNSELITITIGGNDMMKIVKNDLFEVKKENFEKELEEFQQRYNLILQEIRLRNPEAPIILIGLYNPFSIITNEIPEFESIITEWNQTIEATAAKYNNACFVDIQDLFDENANKVYHTDFFHPNGYGYTIMTERIISMMKSCHIEDSEDRLILTE
ncbi:GDSL-type esterase/lipase family protein [Lysinibacillus yapensis]|uniref:GDSL-type esterase/lipase family protein n=1 Tax=Ureibacillus yapensis TaxID=2304605 RepID=UPI00131438CD|nr:GDSL-type esterase/lipase family protein [Lysinibacillus yapensis]